MKDAASTWAVVVGIDTYDHFDHLNGAAADSAATVNWLRKLDVPDDQIMLHAAPCEASKDLIADLHLPVGDCTEAGIWPSFQRLRENQGARLFVFLAGHGLYEPSGQRVFLTREAGQDVVSNLGIAWYARMLRGEHYDSQILVMDGCLNLPYDASNRMQFEEGRRPTVVPKPPVDTSRQVLCCGAGSGQTAKEIKGRGLFTSKLLEALDPDDPDIRLVDIDEQTGAIQFDIFRAVQEVAGPYTEGVVAKEGVGRSPEFSTPAKRLRRGSSPRSSCRPRIPPGSPSRCSRGRHSPT